MASENKKAKTNKRNHPGRDGRWLKVTSKVKGISFYGKCNRRLANSTIFEV